MPYINKNDREKFHPMIEDIVNHVSTSGELNYVVSSMCSEYLRQVDTSYPAINMLIGALECAKLELYRRMAGPYEDVKINDNGDVY